MLLAIDTSNHYASVALHDGQRLLTEHTWLADQQHTRLLLPTIRQLLTEAGSGIDRVTVVAVALGPGSFNGLRVGLSTAKGLALARSIAIVGVPTMVIVASEYGLSTVTMSAGRGQVYRWAVTDGDIGAIDLADGDAPDRVRHAGVLARIAWERFRDGRVDNPATLEPLYVRLPQIHMKKTPGLAAAL